MMCYKYYRCLITFLLLGINLNAFAQAGKLDSSFGKDGIAIWVNGGGRIELQPDNKIIFGGGAADTFDNIFFGLSRYNNDGSMDSSFGTNGQTITSIGYCCDEGTDEAIQPNGKIILAGLCDDFNGKADYTLVRYTSNGQLDNSFNNDGYTLASFNTGVYADYGFGVAIQPDGKIVEVGLAETDTGVPRFGTVRFDSTGVIDETFGTNGEVLTQIPAFAYSAAYSVTIQPDNKIIAAGGSSDGNAPNGFTMVRYNADGAVDSTFGTNGIVTTFFGAGGSSGNSKDDDEVYDIALQPNGKILMVGTSILGTDTINVYNWAIGLARYNTDGSLDNTFGNGGKIRTKIHGYTLPYGYSLSIQPDNKILVAGSCTNGQNPGNFALLRYDTTGILDSTFANKGIYLFYQDSTQAGSVIMQPDGKILVSGSYWNTGLNIYSGYDFIARFISGLTTGILNFSIKQNPILIYPNPIQSQATLQYTLTENENINITLYDMQGKLVQTFIANQTQSQGEYKQQLNFSSTLASGNYILNISNGKGNQEIKISLVR